ncbi:MAG: cobalamin-dependent protein [Syntrophorhabdales bacterium]
MSHTREREDDRIAGTGLWIAITGREKLRIGLINPCGVQQGRGLNATPLYRHIPPQSLIQLKSVTPREHEVVIIDENRAAIDWKQHFDLVGITGTTVQIVRGYEIADQFRRRGIPVVMGGPHVTFMTEEALLHCDSVVRREADEIWTNVLEGAANRKLKPLYDPVLPENLDFAMSQPVSRLLTIPTPRPLPQPRIMITQPQRGCPYGCRFCSVSAFNGARVRQKSVDYVIEEL